MNNIIILILIIIFLIVINNEYIYGLLIGFSHRSKLEKSGFSYIDMREYSKNLDSPEFINGYIDGLG